MVDERSGEDGRSAWHVDGRKFVVGLGVVRLCLLPAHRIGLVGNHRLSGF